MRLEVTRKSDLAMRALHALGAAEQRMKGPELATLIGSSSGFLSQVLTPLVREGWVRSDPGPAGGYALRVALDELSVLEVIETIEGPTDSGRCVLADRPCESEEPCALHVPWLRARAGLRSELEAMSVAESAGAGS